MKTYHFILGPAGSGKSTAIYQELTKRTLEEKNTGFYLFTPEQNTLKAQQELIRHSQVHGMLTLDVLSFSQLSFRVLEELGRPVPNVLDDVSRSILIRRALSNIKQQLLVYKNKTDSPGFITQLKTALSEFSQYSVSPEDLLRMAEEASTSLLSGKLRDLSLIQNALKQLLSGPEKAAVTAEEVPGLLLETLEHSHLLDDAVLYFDGFTGFTPLQLKVIGRMAEHAKEMHFALTVPEEALHQNRQHYTDLFYLSRETWKKLIDVLSREGLSHGQDMVQPDRRPQKKQLSTALTVPADLKTEVCVLEDPTEEIRYLTSRISLDARRNGRRYRKMAVAVSELGDYKEIIRREFSAAGIPFFLDDRMPADGSPVVELVRSVLHIIRDGYGYEDVMTYLKDPLIGEDGGKILDLFDNYIFACGTHGRRNYESSWKEKSYVPASTGDHLPELEEFRDKMLGPVFLLHDALKAEKTCGGKAGAMIRFLEERGIAGGTDRTNPDKQQISGDDLRFLELTEELLERLRSLFAKEEMSIADFTDLVEAGLQDMKAGVIPASMDCVSIGDLKRSRFDDIESLYLVGAVEGKIPQTVTGGGIFTDRERMELIGKDLELAPDDRHDASIQNFYLYLTVNKPTGSLTITLPMTGRDGKALKPSGILKNAVFTRPETEPVTADAYLSRLASELNREASEETAEAALRQARQILQEDGKSCGELDNIRKASVYSYQSVPLKRETAALLYGSPLRSSVTRLEQFECCPYRHFLDYGLRLKERESRNVEFMDLGQIYHQVLDEALRSLKQEGRSLGEADEEELRRLAAEKTELIASRQKGEILQETARNRYISEQICRIAAKTLQVLATQYRSGDFKTGDTEHHFVIRDEASILEGSIDRIDLLEQDGRTWLKVIDYKSGNAEFDLVLAYEGLKMQLPFYAAAAMKQLRSQGKTVTPAGMLLYKIQDPVIRAEERDEAMKQFRMNGLCLKDPEIAVHMDRELETVETSSIIPVKLKGGKIQADSSVLEEEAFEQLLSHTVELVRKDTQRICGGEITVRPVVYGQTNSCTCCPMRPVCGFDRHLPGYRIRNPKVLKKKDIIEKLYE